MNGLDAILCDGVNVEMASGIPLASEGLTDLGDGGAFFVENPRRASLRALSKDPFHQAAWEFREYTGILAFFLQDEHLDSDSIVCDLGAGDGRFSIWLLENYPGRVIAVDVVRPALENLAKEAKALGFEDRLILLHCSFESLPLRTNSVNVVLAINSLYYLGSAVTKALEEADRVMNAESCMISTRHCKEAMLLRALIFNGVREFIEATESDSIRESNVEGDPRFPISTQEEESELYSKMGLQRVAESGVSVFDQMVSLLARTKDEEGAAVREEIDRLGESLEKLRTTSNWKKTFVSKWKKKL